MPRPLDGITLVIARTKRRTSASIDAWRIEADECDALLADVFSHFTSEEIVKRLGTSNTLEK